MCGPDPTSRFRSRPQRWNVPSGHRLVRVQRWAAGSASRRGHYGVHRPSGSAPRFLNALEIFDGPGPSKMERSILRRRSRVEPRTESGQADGTFHPEKSLRVEPRTDSGQADGTFHPEKSLQVEPRTESGRTDGTFHPGEALLIGPGIASGHTDGTFHPVRLRSKNTAAEPDRPCRSTFSVRTYFEVDLNRRHRV